MSFDDFFHKFFKNSFKPPEEDEFFDPGIPRPTDPFLDSQHEDDIRSAVFNIFTNPFEMHKLFERQFQEFHQMLDGFPNNIQDFTHLDQFQVPAIEGGANDRADNDPRKDCLKPGIWSSELDKGNSNNELYDRPKTSSWLDVFLPPYHRQNQDQTQNQPRVYSSFSSVTRKTVRLPDGTVKTEEIIRKPDGTEERTESETLPDRESSPHLDSPINGFKFDIQDFFKMPKLVPPESENILVVPDPRQQVLKPGYEKLNPEAEKVDKDLDNHILKSGSPLFSYEPSTKLPGNHFFVKTIRKKTVTLPNGVTETEEIVQNSDGTQQKTVTRILPDGTTSTTLVPDAFQKGSESSLDQRKDNEVLASYSILKGMKDFVEGMFK